MCSPGGARIKNTNHNEKDGDTIILFTTNNFIHVFPVMFFSVQIHITLLRLYGQQIQKEKNSTDKFNLN